MILAESTKKIMALLASVRVWGNLTNLLTGNCIEVPVGEHLPLLTRTGEFLTVITVT